MKVTISSIENYQDFRDRCKALHLKMLQCKELGIDELVTIEGLIYAYAQAIIEKNEYDQLPIKEKKRRYEQRLVAQRKLLEFVSEDKDVRAKLRRSLNIDKFLTNQL